MISELIAIKQFERVMSQLVMQDIRENGGIKFLIGKAEISQNQFVDKEGFLPLILVTAQSLEKILGKNDIGNLFKMVDNDSAFLQKSLEVDISCKDKPISMALLSMSAAVTTLLDESKNDFITKNESGVREMDLIALLSNMSKVKPLAGISSLSINSDALEQMFVDETTPITNPIQQ